LDLSLDNPGSAKSADLYVLLEAQGVYWCYPSWRPLEAGLDHLALYVLPGEVLLELSPQFTMPAVPPAGPLYFHAGLLEAGGSGLEDLTSTVDSWEFWIE
jgi:hypothetical protein